MPQRCLQKEVNFSPYHLWVPVIHLILFSFFLDEFDLIKVSFLLLFWWGICRKTSPRWTEQVRVCSGKGTGDDGYSWRKYGQKDILGANFPR